MRPLAALLLCAAALPAGEAVDPDRAPPSPPPGVADPARWRWVPEERVSPGDLADRIFVTTFAAPVLFYEEAVGAGGGLIIADLDFRGSRRRESAAAFIARSSEGQESYFASWSRRLHAIDDPGGDGAWLQERGSVSVGGGYRRTLTRRFYGLGPDTRRGDETSYTDELGTAEVTLREGLPRPDGDWVVAAGLRGQGRNLHRGRVDGAPSSEAAFPSLVAEADGVRALWTVASLAYDTRDSAMQPYRGLLLAMDAEVLAAGEGAEAHGPGAVVGLRTAWAVAVPSLVPFAAVPGEADPPTDTIAIGATIRHASGRLPFWALPSLGGDDTLRGHVADRFTGRTSWHASAEWRWWFLPRGFGRIGRNRIVQRLGVAPFWDVGTVSGSADRLHRARAHHCAGIGLRMAFERSALLRLDYARASDDMSVSFTFGNAF